MNGALLRISGVKNYQLGTKVALYIIKYNKKLYDISNRDMNAEIKNTWNK